MGSTTIGGTGRRGTARPSPVSGPRRSTGCRSRGCPCTTTTGRRTSVSMLGTNRGGGSAPTEAPRNGGTGERRGHRAVRGRHGAPPVARVPRCSGDVHVRRRDGAPVLPGEQGGREDQRW